MDMSTVGDSVNESTTDLAITIFENYLEKQLSVYPGGLFRGVFSGIGIPIVQKVRGTNLHT